ncbi:MAG: prepilin peptidase [Kiritimatiellae bacterium]|nr:prepilin peptidase [Kiritimatiellia bacterium]
MPLTWIVLPFLLAFACYGEIKTRRIPNWLTLGGMALGLGAAAIERGWGGLVDSALGLAIAGGLFLPFCLLGVVGGGDMKLMGAVGAITGWPMVLRVLTDTCIAGGLVAVAIMAWKGILLTTLANTFRIMVGMPRKTTGLRAAPMVPYALAITMGTLVAVFLQDF